MRSDVCLEKVPFRLKHCFWFGFVFTWMVTFLPCSISKVRVRSISPSTWYYIRDGDRRLLWCRQNGWPSISKHFWDMVILFVREIVQKKGWSLKDLVLARNPFVWNKNKVKSIEREYSALLRRKLMLVRRRQNVGVIASPTWFRVSYLIYCKK